MKNLNLKIWSVIIAIALALFVNSSRNSGVVSLIVPVVLENMPEQKIILSPVVAQAQITVRGPTHLLTSLTSAPPSFKIRMNGEMGASFQARLEESSLALPPGVEVLTVNPAEMDFILDDLSSKTVPVVVPRIGEVSKDVRLGEILIDPERVFLSGPKTELDTLDTIESSPLDFRQIQKDVTTLLPLRMPGRYLKGFRSKEEQVEVEEVSVTVKVTSAQIEKKFNDLQVEIRSTTPHSFTVNPPKVNVEVSGPKDVMARIKKDQVVPYVKLKKNGQTQVRVHVDLPKRLSVVFVDPERVQLVEEKPSEAKKGKESPP